VISADGGLPILSYELQIGSLNLNDFVTITGGEIYTLQNYFIVTQGVVKGQEYAFRYRGINMIGNGLWSDIAIIKAATVPQAPPKPYYISSSANAIEIGFFETEDNGGSKITEYNIYRDDGDLASAINILVTDYNGEDSQY
jgi:hypothetical protein